MPEFIASCVPETDHNGKPLDAFTRGYFEAIEFTGISIPEELYDEEGITEAEGGLCYDLSRFDEVEWDEASIKKICEECEAFQNDNAEDLEEFHDTYHKGESYSGQTFWLNRNGHGCGFWEYDVEGCKRLSQYSHEEGERRVFLQDGKLYYE